MAREDLPSHQRERLTVIRNSGESLLALLNDLLDLSKIEAGKLSLEEAEFDLEELVNGVHATFSALAASKGLAFSARIASSARGVYRGDPLRVRQILHNLVSNAVKFTEKGRVSLMVRRLEAGIGVVVRDTGVGVPAGISEQLFRKFEQGDASTTRKFGGTGLGLAICRDLAQMMGGSISVGNAKSRGAVFSVCLPLPRVSARRPPKPTAAPSYPPSGQELRVLAADDNGMNQLVLKTLLGQIGIDPVMVSNGRAAVEAWESGSWDLILMDVQMPEMDGPSATALIRSREAAEGRRRTPIVALTANAMQHQVEDYERAGMDGVITKPIEVGQLFAAIERVSALPSGE